MSYRMKMSEAEVYGKGNFISVLGNTECVEFVRQVTNVPPTLAWTRGLKISDASVGGIERGTAIATFDQSGHYPNDGNGKHAAIYLEHNADRILVLDQWNDQGEVKQRPIRFGRPAGTKRSNDANTFYVIE